MIDRFSIFAKRYRGTLTGVSVAAASTTGILVGALLNYDRFVHSMAEDMLEKRTHSNIHKVDVHNEKYPNDLWEYEHYSMEDCLGDAEFLVLFVTVMMIFATVLIPLAAGVFYDQQRAQAALAAAPPQPPLPVAQGAAERPQPSGPGEACL